MNKTFNTPKNTTLFILLFVLSVPFIQCSSQSQLPLIVGANRTETYLPYLKGKNIAVVANPTSVIFKNSGHSQGHTHIVDSLLTLGVNIVKVFSPEHGFRGNIDAGEKVADGVDATTGIPILSLYGNQRKPSPESLQNIDLVLFDIQDVGVRFYTYIATLQLVMQACGDAGIPLFVLDRPNPNGHYVDGPTMEKAHQSFLGMTPIPLVYGMTIGEYASMVNTEEGWLGTDKHPALSVVGLKNYNRDVSYSLPIRPSPNLPNDQSIALYPSLGLFEGTTINAGRGTEAQFTRYGAPELSNKMSFSYTPEPNFGAKYPKHSGEICFGEDLAEINPPNSVDLNWLLKAYANSSKKAQFFLTSGFTKHAGNDKLQKQIEAGLSVAEIRKSWEKDLDTFKAIRAKYLRY